jgi:adenine-specific DNA methylase
VVLAHKQDAREEDGLISPGWEALLEEVLAAGQSVVGTRPVEASSATNMIAQGANALASYVIVVCRPRPTAAAATDRRGFIAALRETLPSPLRRLQQAGIAPVDVAQAAIGPGMAVFSRHVKVSEPDGAAMSVRSALKLTCFTRRLNPERETRRLVGKLEALGYQVSIQPAAWPSAPRTRLRSRSAGAARQRASMSLNR